ncbi:hypothetical protein AB0H00_23610 [Nocardia sp. NPDC023852]|uniref:hypothetical protein n=1 Tax=Nocardia sp. NPDC023852 TaxID=3154697 RepID=UPI0033EB24D1
MPSSRFGQNSAQAMSTGGRPDRSVAGASAAYGVAGAEPRPIGEQDAPLVVICPPLVD